MFLWIKAIHVIAIIAWMAGMLYLIRLYAYHAEETEPVVMERLQVWERKLLRGIVNPAMIVAFATGITMLTRMPSLLQEPWMHVKLTMVLLMTAVHGMASGWRKKLIINPRFKSGRFFRIMNEVPTVLMIVIVVMVIVQPFTRAFAH